MPVDFNAIVNAHAAAMERVSISVTPKDTYRGWAIHYDPPPIPWRGADWRATGPNYDAWTDGEGWTDNGEKAEAATREELVAEIDAWFAEHPTPQHTR